MSNKVSKLCMTGFRGATISAEIMFDQTKPVVLIFGENGTGKSTIADAFDFICNRSYGSLENYSFGPGATVKKYLPSFGGALADLKINLECGSTAWTAILAKDGPSISPSGCPDAKILRRKSILKLIEAQPKNRYEELKTFIAVPGIDSSESNLRKLVDEIDYNFNESVRALSQAKDALEKLWIAEGRPRKTALFWANSESKKNISILQQKVKEADKIIRAFQTSHESMEALDIASRELREAEKTLSEVQEKLKKNKLKNAKHNTSLVNLLKDAKDYISNKESLSQCPVCGQSVDSAKLLKQLENRIEQMQEAASLASSIKRTQQLVDTKNEIKNQNKKTYFEKTKTLALLLKAAQISGILAAKINWEKMSTLFSEQIDRLVEKEARELTLIAQQLQQSLIDKKAADQKSISQHNAIERRYCQMLCFDKS